MIINKNFILYLNQLFVSKASLWLYNILTRGKLNRIYYYILQFNKKRKGMKYLKHRRHIGLSLLFIFSLDKWTLFYTIKELQRSLNTDFIISVVSFLIKISISDYFCQYREVKNIEFGRKDSRAQKR